MHHHQQPKCNTSQCTNEKISSRPLFDHKEEYSTRRKITRTCYDKTMITIFVTIVSLLRIPMLSSAASNYPNCPSQCSCSVEKTVFCNNKGFISVPGDYSSKVQELYLFNNNITNLPRQSMAKLSHLKLLDISGNRITNHALWDGVFSRLSDLENLMLQENKITRITANMFKGLKNLARIYLQNNEITTIDEGAFNNLPSLVELKLHYNRLTSFPKLEFTSSLLLLDLSHNKLRLIRDMALSTVNLENLNLQDNQLSQLRTSVFDDTSKLTRLDISNNRLTAVPQIIKSLTGLHSLNMSVNKMETIPRDTFQLLDRLKVLDLHGMLITSLPYGIIPHGVILNVIDIRQNKLKCDCNLGWLPQYIRIFEQAFVDVDQVVCDTPERLKGRKIKELSPRIDFRCTDEDLMNASLLPEESKTTTTTSPNNVSRKPHVDPCDVFICFNGGTCVIEIFHPKCICTNDWDGQQCQRSLTTSTTTTTTQSTTTKKSGNNHKPPPGRPQLLINTESITETSVEIILPQTNQELLVSVSEIGNDHKPKELRITPRVHPFKVMGLEAGKVYNICIHSPLSNHGFLALKDSLCGTVETEGEIRVIHKPVDDETPAAGVDPSLGNRDGKKPQEGTKEEGDGNEFQPGIENGLHGHNEPVTEASDNDEFQILYPALGAGVGAIIIIVLLVMFFTCYKHKRMIKLKEQNQNNNDTLYTQGTAVDGTSGMTDLEMATVVHHHHHNHYNAGATANGGKVAATKPGSNVQQSSFINNGKARRSTSPNKTSSLGRSSNSSNSTSGTLQTRYIDTPRHYTPGQSYPSLPSTPQQYDMMPQNARTNECLYRNHQNNNNNPIPIVQCVPQSGHYSPENMDELAPLVTGVTMYGQGGVPMEYRDPQPYHPNESQVRHGADNYHMLINPRNIPQYPQPINYPQTNPSRSAFQPIQSPRKNSVRTPTSESGPIMTHVNTAHVMPTSSCMNRNILNENMLLYQEGVA